MIRQNGACARRGFNLVGLILLVLAMVGIGISVMTLSQQANRSGHWFHTGQTAHDLADAGLKQVLYRLTQANSITAAQNSPEMSQELVQVFQNITNGQSSGTVKLLQSPGGQVPAPVASFIQRLTTAWPEIKCELDVELTLTPPQPLWNGALEGVPAVIGERRGTISLVSRAIVKPPTGIAVERRIILEKAYKVINLVPPVLGRFSLFVQDAPPEDPNKVPMRHDRAAPVAGGTVFDGNARPLTLESKVALPLVAAGTSTLDRNQFIAGIQDLKFLDKQGWVYLGGGAGAWKLRIAHGWGEGGESPLLPGYVPGVPTGFTSGDAGFKSRFKTEYATLNTYGCIADFTPPDYGLYTYQHGFATNYELLSLPQLPPPGLKVQNGGTRTALMDFGPGDTSCLRLLGDAAQCSPTLVFGAVDRAVMQRARIRVGVGLPGICVSRLCGVHVIPLFRWGQHTIVESLVTAAFQNQASYEQFGTSVRDDRPFVESLQSVLAAGGSGTYGTDGMLSQSGAAGADKAFTSDLFPAINGFTPATGLPAAAVTALTNGTVDAKDVFKGTLSSGFKAFGEVMQKKLTYEVKPAAFTSKVLVAGVMKVPGAILVASTAPLTIPAVTQIKEGGIVMTRGAMQITGDIVHGPLAAGARAEPLTLVAVKGDITIDASVRNIEAMLIALDGQVKFAGAGDLTITGGVACKVLDVKGIVLGGKRRIKYSEDIDPNGPNRTVFKIFYGGEDRVACVGQAPGPP